MIDGKTDNLFKNPRIFFIQMTTIIDETSIRDYATCGSLTWTKSTKTLTFQG